MWRQIIKHWSGCSNWRKQRVALPGGLKSFLAYQFSIEYRPGKRHGNIDRLSRCPTPRHCQCSDTDNLESLPCGLCSECRKQSQEMQLVDMGEQLQVVRMAKANVNGKLLDLNEESDKGLGVSPTAVWSHPLTHVMQDMPGFLWFFVFLWNWLASWGQGMLQWTTRRWSGANTGSRKEDLSCKKTVASRDYTDDGQLHQKLGSRLLG